MAITFVSPSALSGTTDSTTLNITLPTVQADDVMLLEYTHRGTGTGTLGGAGGSGWTNKLSRTYNTSMSAHLYYKRCDGSESGDALTVSGLTDSCAGCVTVYRGCVTSGDPIEAGTSEENASANESHAAITTLTNGAFVVLTVANTPDLAVTSPSTTSPGALTQRAERLNTTGTDTSICHNSAEKTGAGTTGSLTWAQTNAISASFAYALTPQMPTISMGLGALAILGLSVAIGFTGPSAGALNYQGYAPTVSIETPSGPTISLPAGSLVFTGRTPTVVQQAQGLIAIPAGSLAFTGRDVGVAFGGPSDGRLAYTGYAPTVSQSAVTTITIPAGSLPFTGRTPSLDRAILQPAGALVLQGLAQAVSVGVNRAVPSGSVVLSGQAPTVVNQSPGLIAIPAGTLTFTGRDVGVAFSGPDDGRLAFTGYAPTVSVGSGTTIAVPAGSLAFTGRTPSLDRAIVQPAGSLVFQGQAPAVAAGQNIALPAGQVVLQGQAPVAFVQATVAIPAGSLVWQGLAPSIAGAGSIEIPAGTLTLQGQAPSVALAVSVPAGALTWQGQAPSIAGTVTVTVPAGALTIQGYAATIVGSGAISPGAGALSFQGQAPAVLTSVAIPAGSLVLAGQALTPGLIEFLPVGTLTITGRVPALSISSGSGLGAGELRLTGGALTIGLSVAIPAGTVAWTGYVTSVFTSDQALPDYERTGLVRVTPQRSAVLVGGWLGALVFRQTSMIQRQT